MLLKGRRRSVYKCKYLPSFHSITINHSNKVILLNGVVVQERNGKKAGNFGMRREGGKLNKLAKLIRRCFYPRVKYSSRNIYVYTYIYTYNLYCFRIFECDTCVSTKIQYR